MSSTNVIFNLSDTSGYDITGPDKVKDRLTKRSSFTSTLTVHTYDLWPLLLDPDATQLTRTGSEDKIKMAEVRRTVSAADKVILAMHGPRSATDFGVINDSGNLLGDYGSGSDNSKVPNTTAGSKRVTLETVATLLKKVIPFDKQNYIALLVCYAARTGDAGTKHAIGSAVDWGDSFACKLFRELCQSSGVDQKMSARLGQHSLAFDSGKSEVQTEEAIMSEIALSGFSMAEDEEELKKLALRKDAHECFFKFYGELEKSKSTDPKPALAAMLKIIADTKTDITDAQTKLLQRVHDAKMHSIGKKVTAKGTGKLVYKYTKKHNRIDVYYNTGNPFKSGHLTRVDMSTGAAA